MKRFLKQQSDSILWRKCNKWEHVTLLYSSYWCIWNTATIEVTNIWLVQGYPLLLRTLDISVEVIYHNRGLRQHTRDRFKTRKVYWWCLFSHLYSKPQHFSYVWFCYIWKTAFVAIFTTSAILKVWGISGIMTRWQEFLVTFIFR